MATSSGAEAPLPLLKTMEEITPAWIQEVLNASGVGGTSVADVELQPIGAGNASDTQRALIRYATESPEAPDSLICKFHPSSDDQRVSSAALGTFSREVGSYAILSKNDVCQIPKPFHLAHDDGHLNLVIEDLSKTARSCDQITGCDLQDAKAVVSQMARLHSTRADKRLGDAQPWLMRMSTMGDLFSDTIVAGSAMAPDRFGEQLSEKQYSTIAECAELAGAWYRLPWRNLTLTHGDLRVDNVLFLDSPTTRDAVLIDWQMTGLRSPMYDLAYFLSSSFPVEDRRTHEAQLITQYLEELNDSGFAYLKEQAFADYRLSMLASLATNLLATVALPPTAAANTLILTQLKRGTDAVNDWDCLAAVRSAVATQKS